MGTIHELCKLKQLCFTDTYSHSCVQIILRFLSLEYFLRIEAAFSTEPPDSTMHISHHCFRLVIITVHPTLGTFRTVSGTYRRVQETTHHGVCF